MPDDQGASGTARLRLKKRHERRLEAGHLWVFSNEIDTDATPLKGFPAGAPAVIESATGKFLAHAYVNPASLICARVTSRQKHRPFSLEILSQRLQTALSLREFYYAKPYYRLVHSEGDFLPGLVVDRYGNTLIVQMTTAGMEVMRDDLVEALTALTGAENICLQNNTSIRELEQLPLYVDWVSGGAPAELRIEENDLTFAVPAELGQKTGWFYDHRESRRQLRSWVAGKRVLDLYSYIGGFAINAAIGGAAEVIAVDSSRPAMEAAQVNVNHNNVGDRVQIRCDDAVEAMRSLFSDNERFDAIVLDPPAFIKRKKDLEAGTRHYALNNRLAMKLLKPGGVLLSASCSQALSLQALQKAVADGVPRGNPGVQFLSVFQQAPDHPVNAAMPESLYLKGLIARLP